MVFVRAFALCVPDVTGVDAVSLPSPDAVTVAFIDTVDALDIVVPFDATVPLLTDQEYEIFPLLLYPDAHVFVCVEPDTVKYVLIFDDVNVTPLAGKFVF